MRGLPGDPPRDLPPDSGNREPRRTGPFSGVGAAARFEPNGFRVMRSDCCTSRVPPLGDRVGRQSVFWNRFGPVGPAAIALAGGEPATRLHVRRDADTETLVRRSFHVHGWRLDRENQNTETPVGIINSEPGIACSLHVNAARPSKRSRSSDRREGCRVRAPDLPDRTIGPTGSNVPEASCQSNHPRQASPSADEGSLANSSLARRAARWILQLVQGSHLNLTTCCMGLRLVIDA